MSFKLTPGEVIPAGYTVQVTSWENDGDDYKYRTIHGLTKAEVQQFLNIAPYFYSGCNDKQNFGNDDFNEGIINFVAQNYLEDKISTDLAKRLFGIDFAVHSAEELAEDCNFSSSELADVVMAIQKWLGTPEQYEDDFIRVFQAATVHYVPEEIKVPVLNEVQKFTVRYGEPSNFVLNADLPD